MKRLIPSILILALSACASSTDSLIAKSHARSERALTVLTQRSDADSLAAAALLAGTALRPASPPPGTAQHSSEALTLLTRAVAADSARPELVWLHALTCAQLPTCNSEPIEQRLRQLDPTNGAGWIGSLARADAAHDSERIDAALTAISHTKRFDTYWTALIAHLTRAIADTHTVSLREAVAMGLGDLAAASLPPYRILVDNCKGERLQQPHMLAACRGVAAALQHGDTYITEMIGVAIAKQVWPEGSAPWNAAVEERRIYDYRAALYQKITFRAALHPTEYLSHCAQNRREQDFLAAQLTAAGYNPNPPPS